MKKFYAVLLTIFFLVLSGICYGGAGDVITVNPLATGFPNIILYTTVLDAGGNAITGSNQNAFTVTEQSTDETSAVTETITSFTETVSGSSRISFSLVFDLSGSMTGARLADAKTAANNFLTKVNPRDRGNLTVFSGSGTERIIIASDWVGTDNDGNGSFDIIDAVNTLTASGGTAVYDGTAKGIDSLSQEPVPKAVIVFTDGATGGDVYTEDTVIIKAKNEGVPLYTIGLGLDPQNLKNMATNTGGKYYNAPSAQDMEGIYNSISQSVRSQYTIGYTTHNPNFDGTTRTVTVTYDGTGGTGQYVVNSKPVVVIGPSTRDLSKQSQADGLDLIISGSITDMDAQILGQILEGHLFYKNIADSNYTDIPFSLTNSGNGIYAFSAGISGSIVRGPCVNYYIYISDGIQNTYDPFNYNILPYSITILPDTAPVITYTPISQMELSRDAVITAIITDADADDYIADAYVYYRRYDRNQSLPFTGVAMTNNAGSYSGIIPADQITASGVEYFIAAWDKNGARTDSGSSQQPYTILFETDECPNDPNKTQPGTCGCNTPDTDNDNDGVPNCVDVCPDDANINDPGLCNQNIARGSDDETNCFINTVRPLLLPEPNEM